MSLIINTLTMSVIHVHVGNDSSYGYLQEVKCNTYNMKQQIRVRSLKESTWPKSGDALFVGKITKKK